MRGAVLRAFMAMVGVGLLVAYVLLAALGLLLIDWLLAEPPDLGIALAVVAALTLVAGFVSYRLGAARLLAGIQTRELPRQRAPAVYRRRDRLCEQMSLDAPPLLVADLGAPNALSIGGPREGVIVFDKRLLRLLTIDELEGIMAHELAHLESRDAFVQTLAVSTFRTLAGFLYLLLLPVTLIAVGVARATAWISGRPDLSPNVAALARRGVEVLVGMALSVFTLLLLAYSRRREYVADDRAVAVTGNPRALARALTKIHRAASPNWGLRSLLTIHGEESETDWRRLISTHPPIRERIERLVQADQRPLVWARHDPR
jgi:heat shock protein HtpX